MLPIPETRRRRFTLFFTFSLPGSLRVFLLGVRPFVGPEKFRNCGEEGRHGLSPTSFEPLKDEEGASLPLIPPAEHEGSSPDTQEPRLVQKFPPPGYKRGTETGVSIFLLQATLSSLPSPPSVSLRPAYNLPVRSAL